MEEDEEEEKEEEEEEEDEVDGGFPAVPVANDVHTGPPFDEARDQWDSDALTPVNRGRRWGVVTR